MQNGGYNAGMNEPMQPVRTVGELIAALQQYPAEAPVYGTWEGVVSEIAVFEPKGWRDVVEGTVLLDVDH